MEKNIMDLNNWFGRVNLKLNEAKSIIVNAFQSSFKKVLRQSQHLFIDKKLDFDLLNSSRFLKDILGQLARLDQSQSV